MSGFACPRCGRVLGRSNRGSPAGVLKIQCPACKFRMFDYPRSCAGMVVMKGDRVLLLRRGHPPRKGWLDIPGGFMEAQESPAQAARRELQEETGLTVGHARWLGLYWDRYYLRGFGYFPTMNFYYVARWRSGEPKADDDAAAAEWVPLRGLGRRQGRFAWSHMADVLNDLRRRWRASRRRARGGRG